MITYYNHKTLDVMICFSTMTAIATKNEIFLIILKLNVFILTIYLFIN